jgi:hypothetical protein
MDKVELSLHFTPHQEVDNWDLCRRKDNCSVSAAGEGRFRASLSRRCVLQPGRSWAQDGSPENPRWQGLPSIPGVVGSAGCKKRSTCSGLLSDQPITSSGRIYTMAGFQVFPKPCVAGSNSVSSTSGGSHYNSGIMARMRPLYHRPLALLRGFVLGMATPLSGKQQQLVRFLLPQVNGHLHKNLSIGRIAAKS